MIFPKERLTLISDILEQVNREYLITANSVKPFSSVWKLAASSGNYTLKQIETDPRIFSELARIINNYHDCGLKELIPVLPTRNGEYYLRFADGFYALSPWHEGEKASFGNPDHLKLIARCFGKLHAFSQSTALPSILCNNCGLGEYQTRQLFMESLLPMLHERKSLNRIDRTILKWGEYFLQQGRHAVLELTKLKDLWPLLENQKGFCHNDPAPGNIIINNVNCHLIDFEFSNCDLFIKEFAILALRALQANHWEPKIMDLLIAAYIQERPLTVSELKVLPFLLNFPRRFWRLCTQRYQERLSWNQRRFQSRLWSIITEEKERCRFLESWLPESKV